MKIWPNASTSNTPLRALRPTDISPHILLQTMGANAGNMAHLYAVSIDDKGVPTMYATSDTNGVPFAALYMQEMFLQRLMKK